MADTKIAYESPDPGRPATETPSLPVLEYETHRHDPYAALRFRDYRFYSIGWLCASIGFQMQIAAIAWEIYKWTGSAMKMGLAGGIQALPLIILALPAGHLADRYNRRTLAALGQVTAAICSIALAVLSLSFAHYKITAHAATITMFWIIFAGGVFSTFSRPARSAILPHIVPTSAFTNAVTWSAFIFEFSSVAGPAIAGFIIALISPAAVYIFATILYIAFLVFLLLLHYQPKPHEKRTHERRELLAGLKFVWREKVILASLTLDLFAVLLGGAVYLMPIFAQEILHVGPVGFGWLRAAPAIGAFSMAMLLAHRHPLRRPGRALLWAVSAFGLATIIFGLSRSFWLSMAALVLTGAFDNISVVIRHTLIQILTPDSKRGRVSAVNSVFIGASNELGGFESGVTAHYLGPVTSVVAGGIGTLLVVASVALAWPQLRSLGPLQSLKPSDDD
ncbi:MAG TPA: MFS transporter [Tepidisphaeraceae bacterium]|nr:MFS transporter [Tepidisphaeraceae bacterium]